GQIGYQVQLAQLEILDGIGGLDEVDLVNPRQIRLARPAGVSRIGRKAHERSARIGLPPTLKLKGPTAYRLLTETHVVPSPQRMSVSEGVFRQDLECHQRKRIEETLAQGERHSIEVAPHLGILHEFAPGRVVTGPLWIPQQPYGVADIGGGDR